MLQFGLIDAPTDAGPAHGERRTGLPAASMDMPFISALVQMRTRLYETVVFVEDASLTDDMLVASVYRIFTARAAAEIELAQALARLQELQPQRRPSIAAR